MNAAALQHGDRVTQPASFTQQASVMAVSSTRSVAAGRPSLLHTASCVRELYRYNTLIKDWLLLSNLEMHGLPRPNIHSVLRLQVATETAEEITLAIREKRSLLSGATSSNIMRAIQSLFGAVVVQAIHNADATETFDLLRIGVERGGTCSSVKDTTGVFYCYITQTHGVCLYYVTCYSGGVGTETAAGDKELVYLLRVQAEDAAVAASNEAARVLAAQLVDRVTVAKPAKAAAAQESKDAHKAAEILQKEQPAATPLEDVNAVPAVNPEAAAVAKQPRKPSSAAADAAAARKQTAVVAAATLREQTAWLARFKKEKQPPGDKDVNRAKAHSQAAAAAALPKEEEEPAPEVEEKHAEVEEEQPAAKEAAAPRASHTEEEAGAALHVQEDTEAEAAGAGAKQIEIGFYRQALTLWRKYTDDVCDAACEKNQNNITLAATSKAFYMAIEHANAMESELDESNQASQTNFAKAKEEREAQATNLQATITHMEKEDKALEKLQERRRIDVRDKLRDEGCIENGSSLDLGDLASSLLPDQFNQSLERETNKLKQKEDRIEVLESKEEGDVEEGDGLPPPPPFKQQKEEMEPTVFDFRFNDFDDGFNDFDHGVTSTATTMLSYLRGEYERTLAQVTTLQDLKAGVDFLTDAWAWARGPVEAAGPRASRTEEEVAVAAALPKEEEGPEPEVKAEATAGAEAGSQDKAEAEPVAETAEVESRHKVEAGAEAESQGKAGLDKAGLVWYRDFLETRTQKARLRVTEGEQELVQAGKELVQAALRGDTAKTAALGVAHAAEETLLLAEQELDIMIRNTRESRLLNDIPAAEAAEAGATAKEETTADATRDNKDTEAEAESQDKAGLDKAKAGSAEAGATAKEETTADATIDNKDTEAEEETTEIEKEYRRGWHRRRQAETEAKEETAEAEATAMEETFLSRLRPEAVSVVYASIQHARLRVKECKQEVVQAQVELVQAAPMGDTAKAAALGKVDAAEDKLLLAAKELARL